MKIFATLTTLSLLASQTTAADESLRISDKRMKELEDFAKTVDTTQGTIDTSSLGITDEREAGLACNFITRNLQGYLDEYIPFKFDCDCNLIWGRRFIFIPVVKGIDYDCNSDFCIDDFKELLPIEEDMPFPLANNTCMKPSITGTGKVRGGDLTSTVCTGSTEIVANITMIDEYLEETDFESEYGATYSIELPDVCLTVDHTIDELATFTDCSISIADETCGCTPCEDGSGVELDCTDQIEDFVPDFLKPYVNETVQCIYPGVFEGENSFSGGLSLYAPFLTLNDPPSV